MSVKMIAATPASSKRSAIFERGHLRRLRPAFDRDLAVARVEADRDAAGEFFRRAFHKLGIAHRSGADDHPRNTFRQPGFNRFQIADAAAELYRHADRLEHRLDSLRVHRLAGKGAVEIDHMQILEPLRGEGLCLRRRVEVEHGRARHVALFEPHAVAVFRSMAGNRITASISRSSKSGSPKRWLFSG